MAVLYFAQGEYSKAEPLYKQSLAINKKALGHNHLRVGITSLILANLYAAQGRYAEAELQYKLAMEIIERALGPDHPRVAKIVGELANFYKKMGRDDQAKKLLDRLKRIRASQ